MPSELDLEGDDDKKLRERERENEKRDECDQTSCRFISTLSCGRYAFLPEAKKRAKNLGPKTRARLAVLLAGYSRGVVEGIEKNVSSVMF